MKNATRIWPTAVTLLCSLIKWVEIGAGVRNNRHPRISSTASDSKEVTNYLDHCGLHDYVGRPKESKKSLYSDAEIVKIVREKSKSLDAISEREEAIIKLIENNCNLDSENVEWFNSIVITETFANITEHGNPYRDQGWWILAQKHKSHGYISLCLADNGIGIKNSLLTGPQKSELYARGLSASTTDGDFISAALSFNISGAFDASLKQGLLLKRYERGSRRGNGLSRIKETCIKLGIEWGILSHYGYAFLDKSGKIINVGNRKNRIYGGTMYWFKIEIGKQ